MLAKWQQELETHGNYIAAFDNEATVRVCIAALDALALALAEHNHVWTNEERQLYEKAVRRLKERKSNA